MKIQELLNEDRPDLNVLLKLLRRDCSKFLESVDEPLYRGVKHTVSKSVRPLSKFIYKGAVRENRRPKDSPQSLHDAFDRGFKRNFGWKARSEGLFCTFNRNTAEGYTGDEGRAFAIFPIGDFSYIWSPSISDAYGDLYDSWGSWSDDVEEVFNKIADDMGFLDGDEVNDASYIDDRSAKIEIIEEFMLHHSGDFWTASRINDAEGSAKEIMIRCNTYYAIDVRELKTEFGVTMTDVMKEARKGLK